MEEARKILREGAVFPDQIAESRRQFSDWLAAKLVDRLRALGDFDALDPVWLGSYARQELTPKSDIDLLFAGEEDKVTEFVGQAFKAGLKLRSRTPADSDDWTVGVEPFDVLALGFAAPETESGRTRLEAQKEGLRAHRKAILTAIRREREERRQRQDSISTLLEPNLKFGAGGLRDIEQALSLHKLFIEHFEGVDPYPFKILKTIKEEFLYLRSYLHVMGSGDVLSAHDQLELARELQVESPQTLMKFVQKQLERASFYADWVVAHIAASKKARLDARKPISGAADAIARLKQDPSLLNQFEIRLRADELLRETTPADRGRLLHKAVFADDKDAYFIALYRSRMLEVLIPDLRKLRGLVQHDHYHRFTADAHLVQTLREVQRAKSSKASLMAMSKLTKDLTAQEWWTLKLTALFHDLAKGRKGDHSTEGAALVDKYFEGWEYTDTLRDEVHWLVENHLILSTAAFRQNPKSQSTWRRLFERGVEGRRLVLLALFTAIDIRATNPEAWTAWKSQLMLDLVESLRSSEALSLQKHLDYATKNGILGAGDWLPQVDPLVMESLPPGVLLKDLAEASASLIDLSPKVWRAKNGRIWVRFHRRADQSGLLLSFVKRLFGLGLAIQASSVSTLPGIGVYDWFCLRTEKSPRQISTWLNLESKTDVKIPAVEFQSIDLMSQEEDEWIFSFRGRDQRGLLLAAAHALNEAGLSLRWARAHTWGQQIEDIFAVRPLGEVEETLNNLRKRFVT